MVEVIIYRYIDILSDYRQIEKWRNKLEQPFQKIQGSKSHTDHAGTGVCS